MLNNYQLKEQTDGWIGGRIHPANVCEVPSGPPEPSKEDRHFYGTMWSEKRLQKCAKPSVQDEYEDVL